MKLYNSLSKNVEEIEPIVKGNISLYTCGPTVYNYLHIGNWAAYIRWDILVRALQAEGLEVNWFMNITDVGHLVSDADEGEDKLEKGARREGKSAWEVADYYTKDFINGLQKLGIEVPLDHLIKATDHIPEQIELIKVLESKGVTYLIDDGVYFDTSKLDDYGKLARLKLDDLKAGARVMYNDQKRNITDFALWKFSPKDNHRDMEWDSPWGKGFPGWHIECSAMAIKYLGETLDIHAGGIDHIPVHHTNEIAQSETATGKPFAKLWLHSNFLTVDNTKISKSLDNGYTLSDLEDKGYTPLDFRMFILQSHYRNETNFTFEGLNGAHNRLSTLRAVADLRWQTNETSESWVGNTNSINSFKNSIYNDLNTPEALSDLSTYISFAEDKLVNNSEKDKFIEDLRVIDDLLGLKLLDSSDVNDLQKDLITKRQQARDAQDWDKADSIREQLLNQNINVRDTKHGQVWSRV